MTTLQNQSAYHNCATGQQGSTSRVKSRPTTSVPYLALYVVVWEKAHAHIINQCIDEHEKAILHDLYIYIFVHDPKKRKATLSSRSPYIKPTNDSLWIIKPGPFSLITNCIHLCLCIILCRCSVSLLDMVFPPT